MNDVLGLPLLDETIFNSTIAQWLSALLLAAATFLLLSLAVRLAAGRLEKVVAKTELSYDDLIPALLLRTKWFSYAAASLYTATRLLSLPGHINNLIINIIVLTLILQSAVWLSFLVSGTLQKYFEKRHESDPGSYSAFGLLNFLASLLIWSLAILLMIGNLGVDITALVAGLGVGGIAIALAVQNVLGDLFASLSIVLDRPFQVGDFIIVGEMLGTVERIGIKTTRVRSLSGEQLVFANSDLLASRIRNYKRMQERRVVFEFGVVYETAFQQIKEIPKMIQQIIESIGNTRFDRTHFKNFGDFSLVFETVYYVLEADYNLYMDIQQQINLEMLRLFREREIVFAFPTQTLNVAMLKTAGQNSQNQAATRLETAINTN